MFPWEIARAIAERPLGYLPLGTLEWHGEHCAVGLDSLKAHAVCVNAARISGGIVLPPLHFAADTREDLPGGAYLTGGVERGERYHVPGNMFWLRTETYTNLLLDMYEAMRRRGLRAIVVLSGHWSSGTLPVIEASGAAFSARCPQVGWLLLTDQQVLAEEPPGSPLFYPHEHAAGGEVSLLMHLRPDLVDLEKTFATRGPLAEDYSGAPEHLRRRAETRDKYIGVLRGVEDDSNDPELTASARRGMALLEAIAGRVAARAAALLEDTLRASP
jgi:creatinine amidohydrolase